MKKLKLIFDITILANGVEKDSSRSGIYFTALNILKKLVLKEDINLNFYCTSQAYYDAIKIVKSELPQNNYKIITDNNCWYTRLKSCKENFKKEKKYIKKFLIQLLLLFFSPFFKMLTTISNIFQGLKNDSIFFSPVYAVPKSLKIKKYTILYDLIPVKFPEYNEEAKEGRWFNLLLKSLNKNDYYFAISNATRNDFLEYYPEIDSEKITTTLLACNESFCPQSQEKIIKIKEKYHIPLDKKYIFSLCTLEPRKNLIRAVKTFVNFIDKSKADDLLFVLGGGHYDTFMPLLEQELQCLGEYKHKILKTGYIDDEDLPALYSGAEWFVYTSMYEGFGLPPLEAMSCGCPVITSNNSSLPEVVGDAGIMIDWDSDEQHIKAYEKYYYDKDLREQFAKKGLERAKLFSWDKCVNTIIERMYND